MKWILVRLGGLAHGIVTKTVHKTLPGGRGGEGFWEVGGSVRSWGSNGCLI